MGAGAYIRGVYSGGSREGARAHPREKCSIWYPSTLKLPCFWASSKFEKLRQSKYGCHRNITSSRKNNAKVLRNKKMFSYSMSSKAFFSCQISDLFSARFLRVPDRSIWLKKTWPLVKKSYFFPNLSVTTPLAVARETTPFTRVRTNFWTDELFYLCNPLTLNSANSVTDCGTFCRSRTCTLPWVTCKRKADPRNFLSVQKLAPTPLNRVLYTVERFFKRNKNFNLECNYGLAHK